MDIKADTIDAELYSLLKYEPFVWLSYSKLEEPLFYIFSKPNVSEYQLCVNVLSQSNKVDKYNRQLVSNNFIILSANETSSLNANMLWINSFLKPLTRPLNLQEISQVVKDYTKKAIQHFIAQNSEKYSEMVSALLWNKKILLFPASIEELSFLSLLPAYWLADKHLLITPQFEETGDLNNYLKLDLIVCRSHPSTKIIEDLRAAGYIVYDFQLRNFPKDFRPDTGKNAKELLDQVKFLIRINQMENPSIFFNILRNPDKQQQYINISNKINSLISNFQAYFEKKSSFLSPELLAEKIFQGQKVLTDISNLKVPLERLQSKKGEIASIKAKKQRVQQDIAEFGKKSSFSESDLKNFQARKQQIETSIQTAIKQIENLKECQTRLDIIENFEKDLKGIEKKASHLKDDIKSLSNNLRKQSSGSNSNKEKLNSVLKKSGEDIKRWRLKLEDLSRDYQSLLLKFKTQPNPFFNTMKISPLPPSPKDDGTEITLNTWEKITRILESYNEQALRIISSLFKDLNDKKRTLPDNPEKLEKIFLLQVDDNKKSLNELTKNMQKYAELLTKSKELEQQQATKIDQLSEDISRLNKTIEIVSIQDQAYFPNSLNANNIDWFFTDLDDLTFKVEGLSKTSEILDDLNRNLKNTLIALRFPNATELTDRIILSISTRNFLEIFNFLPPFPKLKIPALSPK